LKVSGCGGAWVSHMARTDSPAAESGDVHASGADAVTTGTIGSPRGQAAARSAAVKCGGAPTLLLLRWLAVPAAIAAEAAAAERKVAEENVAAGGGKPGAAVAAVCGMPGCCGSKGGAVYWDAGDARRRGVAEYEEDEMVDVQEVVGRAAGSEAAEQTEAVSAADE